MSRRIRDYPGSGLFMGIIAFQTAMLAWVVYLAITPPHDVAWFMWLDAGLIAGIIAFTIRSRLRFQRRMDKLGAYRRGRYEEHWR